MCSYSPGDEEGERSLFLWRDRARLPACSLQSPSRTRKGIFWAHRGLQYAIQLCWSEWSLETQKKKKKNNHRALKYLEVIPPRPLVGVSDKEVDSGGGRDPKRLSTQDVAPFTFHLRCHGGCANRTRAFLPQ